MQFFMLTEAGKLYCMNEMLHLHVRSYEGANNFLESKVNETKEIIWFDKSIDKEWESCVARAILLVNKKGKAFSLFQKKSKPPSWQSASLSNEPSFASSLVSLSLLLTQLLCCSFLPNFLANQHDCQQKTLDQRV
jgi:hypothetical protein